MIGEWREDSFHILPSFLNPTVENEVGTKDGYSRDILKEILQFYFLLTVFVHFF